jgi:hypothetical protein
MLYTVLCYNSEEEVAAWSKEKDDAVLAKLAVVGKKLKDEGKLRFSARLMYTTAAVTLRPGRDPLPIVDGPFAETKEQLLGFYIIECETLEEAIEAGRRLAGPRESGALEIRPMRSVHEGSGL